MILENCIYRLTLVTIAQLHNQLEYTLEERMSMGVQFITVLAYQAAQATRNKLKKFLLALKMGQQSMGILLFPT
jgi:hypothetical protein